MSFEPEWIIYLLISIYILTDALHVTSKVLVSLYALNSSSVICIALCHGNAGKIQIFLVCLLIDKGNYIQSTDWHPFSMRVNRKGDAKLSHQFRSRL